MYPYQVVRSRRKTVSLEIRPDCSVLVRAPLRMREADIRDFVLRHQDWMDRHMPQVQARQRPEPTREQAEALILRAKEILPGKVAHYAKIMGVAPTGIMI